MDGPYWLRKPVLDHGSFQRNLDAIKQKGLREIRMLEKKLANYLYLVRLAGIEHTTLGLGGQYSIH